MGNKKWTACTLKTEALKYKTKIEFIKNNNSAYVTAVRLKIINDICSHMSVMWYPKWNLNTLKQEALKYYTKKEFFNKNSKAYHSAKYYGVLDEICVHMKPLWKKKWNKKTLSKEALKYNSVSEFIKNNNAAYLASCRMGNIKEITSHMVRLKHMWTNEELKKEALKYKNKTSFIKNSINAYSAAQRNGILKDICSHMIIVGGASNQEMDLFNTIKRKYPSALTLRENKIRINTHPYIKRLEIDIYIPELRKGIEFDGKYWHSIQGLKRSHPTWSEIDLINYHSIKDDYFKSKGIEILHIKEKDWKKNKEKCVNKCVKFLQRDICEL